MITGVTRLKYKNTKARAKKRGIAFHLSIVEYSQLLQEAGITAEDVGQGASDYCLGRYNDEGDYKIGNCRFITASQNHKEGMISKPIHCLSLGGGSHDSVKGNKHYSSRGYVVTPWGTFETLQQAADHPLATCNSKTVCKRIHRQESGYSYLSVDTPP